MPEDEQLEEYQELIDEAQDDYETQQDLSDGQLSQVESYPAEREKADMYNWFWKVVGLSEPNKLLRVGNLSTQEIGDHGIPVRDAMKLAHLGYIFKHPKFGKFFANWAKLTSLTSMSKKGWFMEMSISQRKIRERQKESGFSEKKKKSLFGGKNK